MGNLYARDAQQSHEWNCHKHRLSRKGQSWETVCKTRSHKSSRVIAGAGPGVLPDPAAATLSPPAAPILQEAYSSRLRSTSETSSHCRGAARASDRTLYVTCCIPPSVVHRDSFSHRESITFYYQSWIYSVRESGGTVQFTRILCCAQLRSDLFGHTSNKCAYC